MVLVTLGTQKQSFERLLKYIENSQLNGEIIVQAGKTNFKSSKMKIFDYVPYERMYELIENADVIITHGGTGSIITPLKKGKKVIGCARLQKYDEHIDDHQLELVDTFFENGYILKIDDETKLDDVISELENFKPKKFESNSKVFIEHLKQNI